MKNIESGSEAQKLWDRRYPSLVMFENGSTCGPCDLQMGRIPNDPNDLTRSQFSIAWALSILEKDSAVNNEKI